MKMKWIGSLLLLVLLAGCEGGMGVKDGGEDEGGDGTVVSSDTGDARTTGIDEPLGILNGQPIDQAASPMSVRTIYFEFDRSEIRPEFIPVVEAHGRLLAAQPDRKIVLEGHADERGSREYNIGLGERRATSVRRMLLGYGARDSQIRMVSYGEERPAVIGHNEAAWSKNRRVEVSYE